MTDTYTIELTRSQINHLLADLNIARIDLANDGFTASERANRRLAEDIIHQVADDMDDDGPVMYGGEPVAL